MSEPDPLSPLQYGPLSPRTKEALYRAIEYGGSDAARLVMYALAEGRVLADLVDRILSNDPDDTERLRIALMLSPHTDTAEILSRWSARGK